MSNKGVCRTVPATPSLLKLLGVSLIAPQDSDETRGRRKQGDRMTGDNGGLVFRPEGPSLATPVRHSITEDTSTR